MHVFFLVIPLVHCAGVVHGQSLIIECDTLRIQSNLNSPWNIEPLTENELLLTERAGTVWKVDLELGERSELHTFENVAMEGQSGWSERIEPMVEGICQLHLTDLASGAYTVRIRAEGVPDFTQTILKQ